MRLATLLLCLAAPALSQPAADIVILGEVHDNPDAHLGQAAVLEELQPTAVVFEMLTAKEADKADADRTRIEAAWEASGWPDYPIYAPLFDALDEARIIGAAAPRDSVKTVYSDGAATVFGPDATLYGLDAPLAQEEQATRETMQFAAHCEAMPRDMMGGMVAVQRYRDAVFARAALEALEAYGPPVAVIAGNGHARTDWGIPAMIARAAPQVTTHAIGFVESQTDIPFDETRIVPPADRDDPCATLNNQ
ncbi:ChaN family lipoprotein [Roseovarius atlanticus]|uniref:ChaN family lipoprotein n=1 Tax=Roseovarius atlanticus TaxID=1641875 RepID=UPI001C946E22|nr:ChaN family lipoprotein [Roseovarius atlanticus]MBY5988290.1 ChaN family lipoprotein [Roseovarius atlanticus]MBY6123681.1 ChaN family lipoprotein [Roseovarius atlanticus]MBY6148176.1 ChaN family lipoprotein [Roseovarius atlanticus]